MEPQANGTSRGYGGAQYITAAAREHVVMISGGRAARPGQPGERGGGRISHDLLVDSRPDRVQLGQPAEQRRVGSPAPGGPLVEVMVRVDQARGGQAAGGPYDQGPGQVEAGRGGAWTDRGELAAVDGYMPRRVLGPPGVHGDDVAPVDQDRRHR